MTTAVKVRCSGKLHEIVLTDAGRLVFPDHAHEAGGTWARAQVDLATLGGGAVCRCGEVLLAWRERTSRVRDRLPEAIRDAHQRACDRRASRMTVLLKKPNLGERLAKLMEGRLNMALSRALVAGTYREGTSRWVNCESIVSAHASWVEVAPHVTGESKVVRHPKHWEWQALDLRLIGVVHPVGYARVLRAIPTGLVDGHVVVALVDGGIHGQQPHVRGRRPGDLLVRAGKQSRGLTVVTATALVRRDSDGSWHIVRWVK
jgi:hypothetical protein